MLSAPRTCGVWLIHSGPGRSQGQKLFCCWISFLAQTVCVPLADLPLPLSATISCPPSPASGFSSSPFSELGGSQVSNNPWANLKRMSTGPRPHLVSLFSSSIRQGSRLSSWGGEEGPGGKMAPILGAHRHGCPVAPEGFSEESG